jgi:hypothetical protein
MFGTRENKLISQRIQCVAPRNRFYKTPENEHTEGGLPFFPS